MKNKNTLLNIISRRKFITTTATTLTGVSLTPLFSGFTLAGVNSKFAGIQIGAISYSWRSMPCSAENILKYCKESGINSIEIMGNTVEEFAGIPVITLPPVDKMQMTKKELTEYQEMENKIVKEQRKWRLSVAMDKYQELKQIFNGSGINIHAVKFAPANWTDEEIDYAFKSAKALGAKGITNEIGEEACIRLGKFAKKHNMLAIFHNHAQPGSSGFSFEKFLAYSSNNMLNFDAGHYFGATGDHPNYIIEKFHNRIFSIHLKDKTGKNNNPPNKNKPWGEGDTPIADMLKLVRKNKWPIYFDIELEYPIPESSNAQNEVIKCLKYCKKILQ